ncbi:MAG: hypothetical protein JWQ78_2207 [Sediminibacterium sp.]|nr:hypothetical protein [Sediminibacterium sp.]
MKAALLCIGLALAVSGCRDAKKIPDVSGVSVPLKTERFEKDFFALDTLHMDASLQQLNQAHPGFTQDFLFNILGTTPALAAKDVPAFLRSYRDLNTDAARIFGDFPRIEKQVKHGMQFVHYYFPAYKLPEKLITFIGPINSYGNIITANALAVGLQLYMGKDYPMYLSENAQQLYPLFISRRFTPDYIPVNCMKNIIDDMYPNASMGRPLVEQMVESGKRLYVLDRLLPEAPDSLKTGYTQKQLDESYESEKNIWSFFVQNDLLYKADPNLTRDYMSDGPNTPALGDASPGNIGQFVGAQIVAKWMEKNKGLSLDALMKTPAKQVFEEARYKPK